MGKKEEGFKRITKLVTKNVFPPSRKLYLFWPKCRLAGAVVVETLGAQAAVAVRLTGRPQQLVAQDTALAAAVRLIAGTVIALAAVVAVVALGVGEKAPALAIVTAEDLPAVVAAVGGVRQAAQLAATLAVQANVGAILVAGASSAQRTDQRPAAGRLPVVDEVEVARALIVRVALNILAKVRPAHCSALLIRL